MAVNEEIPQSRIMLTYRTMVEGEPRDVDLPFRLFILGDLSRGTSKERRTVGKNGLDARTPRTLDGRNLNAVMKDMDMRLSLKAKNRIDVDKAMDARTEVDVELKIDSMQSFTPKAIAAQVPQLQALLMLKTLLKEVQGNLDNRKAFRDLLRKLNKMDAKTRGAQLGKLLGELKADTHADSFRVPKRLPKQAEAKTEEKPEEKKP